MSITLYLLLIRMAKVNIILISRCQSIIGEDTLLPARGVSWATVGFYLAYYCEYYCRMHTSWQCLFTVKTLGWSHNYRLRSLQSKGSPIDLAVETRHLQSSSCCLGRKTIVKNNLERVNQDSHWNVSLCSQNRDIPTT